LDRPSAQVAVSVVLISLSQYKYHIPLWGIFNTYPAWARGAREQRHEITGTFVPDH
jgi:hypothetical protein